MRRVCSWGVVDVLMLALVACPGSGASEGEGTSGAEARADAGGPPGIGFFTRLPGLWTGQVGDTPLGSFPLMDMDVRAADASWLFSRTDLDAEDDLRFGFAVESVDGAPAVVFRNGGFFGGLLRDTETVLVDADEDAGVYHFCAETSGCFFSLDGGCLPVTGGCGFVDSVFTFSSDTQLVMNTHVNGQEHEIWTASRAETRTVPAAFPGSDVLPEDAGWPDLPSEALTVTWTTPLSSATDVWVIATDTPCAQPSATGFSCTASRQLETTVDAGATSATLRFDQILPGTYDAVALLDMAGGFATVLSPEPGDQISDPSAGFTVPASGQGSAALPIVFTVP